MRYKLIEVEELPEALEPGTLYWSEEFEISALRIEQIVSGGETLRVRIPALKPGTYEFVGEFHEETAQGRIVAE